MSQPTNDEPAIIPMPANVPTATADPVALQAEAVAPTPELPKVSSRYIWLLVLALFGVFMAFITPLAISLTIRVNALTPGHPEYVGFITGAGVLARVE